MSLIWLNPNDCDPPHYADHNKLVKFIEIFEKDGFDKDCPVLIGYPLNGRVQLLSGSHRQTAAKITGIKIPVTLFLKSDIESAWGNLALWSIVMEQIPVNKLDK